MDFKNFLKSELNRLFSDNMLIKLGLEEISNNKIDPNNFFMVSSYDSGIEANFFKNTTEFSTHLSILKNVLQNDPRFKKYKIKLDVNKEDINDYSITIRVSNDSQHLFRIFYNKIESFGLQNEIEQYNDNSFLKIDIFKVKRKNLSEFLTISFIVCLFKYIIPSVYSNFNEKREILSHTFDLNTLRKEHYELFQMLETIFLLDRNIEKYKDITRNIISLDDGTKYEIWTIDIDMLISKNQLVYSS